MDVQLELLREPLRAMCVKQGISTSLVATESTLIPAVPLDHLDCTFRQYTKRFARLLVNMPEVWPELYY